MLHSLKKKNRKIFTAQEIHRLLWKENSPFRNPVLYSVIISFPHTQTSTNSSFGNSKDQTTARSCRDNRAGFPLRCHFCCLFELSSHCQALIQILSPDFTISALQQAGGGPSATQLATSDLLSFSSAPAALSSGASQPAEYPYVGDRPLLSGRTEGNVSPFRRATLRDPHPPAGDATSSRRRWRSFCASSPGDLDTSWQFLCTTVEGTKKKKKKGETS